MSHPACPECTLDEVLEHADKWECVTCAFEWPKTHEADIPDGPRIVKDAYGSVLADGDCVTHQGSETWRHLCAEGRLEDQAD